MTCAIIIPAYNAAPYLAETIESALRQTRTACRILVVDDGSTDGTAEICATFGDGIAYLRQENAGVSAARNYGASQTSSEWLLFLDADDRLLPEALERLLGRAGESPCGTVYGQTIYFDDRTGERRLHGLDRSEGPAPAGALGSFWKSAITTPGAAIIRRSIFEQAGGFDPLVNTLADRDLWLKTGVLAPFGFTRCPVIEKRTHGANMSGDVDLAIRQALIVQLGFLDWCAARHISSAFLKTTPQGIFDNMLRKALDTRRLHALRDLASLAKERGVVTPLLETVRSYLTLPPWAAEMRLRGRSFARRFTHPAVS